jgi:hypothetical protein
VALTVLAVSMTALLAVAVIAVDLGRLAHTATEVQTVADVAATAGATAILGVGADPVVEALSVVTQNRVEGAAAALLPSAVELGSYDFASGTFVAGRTPLNAVRATATATVQNLIATILGSPSSMVQKTATAAVTGVGSAAPMLPLVIGDCKFQAYQSSGSCVSLPGLRQAPNPNDDSAWTSLSSSAASAGTARKYLPTSCGGGGSVPPGLHVGYSVNRVSGSTTSLLQAVSRCARRGIRRYVVPIVACGPPSQFSQAMPVVGFATIDVTSVRTSGARKGIDLGAICNTTAAGGAGGGNYGTETVALVD